jgi:hypothetical protein
MVIEGMAILIEKTGTINQSHHHLQGVELHQVVAFMALLILDTQHVRQLTKKHQLMMQQSTVTKQEDATVLQPRETLMNHLTMIPECLFNVAHLLH